MLNSIAECRAGVLNFARHQPYVRLNDQALAVLANKLVRPEPISFLAEYFAALPDRSVEARLLFIFNWSLLSACLWPKPKWHFVYPDFDTSRGSFMLATALLRGAKEGFPLLTAKGLAGLTAEQGRQLFRGDQGTSLYEGDARRIKLIEAGKALCEHYEGSVLTLLESCRYDAGEIALCLARHFPGMDDGDGARNLWFLKKAQLFAATVAGSRITEQDFPPITNLESLYGCADYKIPQLLRACGVLVYSDALAEKIDTRQELPYMSEDEVSIRSSMLLALDMLSDKLAAPAIAVGDMLWDIAGDVVDDKPHHLTRTLYY